MAWTPSQKYIAEFIGTFGLLISVTGAACLTVGTFTSGDIIGHILVIGLAIGLGIMAMIFALGDISGGHFNPAVTIAVFLSGRMPARDVVPYIVAQVAGAIVGVATIAGIAYGNASVWPTTMTIALASQGYSGNGSIYNTSLASVFLLEVAFTFAFVFVILYVTREGSFSKNLAPVAIGFMLAMLNIAAIGMDGASFNPARSFAPAVLSAGWSGQTWAIQQDWMFWVAPIVGACLAAGVERFLREARASKPSGGPADA